LQEVVRDSHFRGHDPHHQSMGWWMGLRELRCDRQIPQEPRWPRVRLDCDCPVHDRFFTAWGFRVWLAYSAPSATIKCARS